VKSETNTYWSTVIEPNESPWHYDFKALWDKRYLLWLFIKRDVTVQYKQTILGFAWYFVGPIVTMLTYMLVFGKIAGIPTDGIPQPLFYLSGICLWEYFSLCLTESAGSLQINANLFGKVYFPRLVSPVSKVISRMFRFVLQLVVLVVVYVLYAVRGYDLHPNLYLLLFPVLVVLLQCIAMGLGFIVSAMSVKYRDLTNVFSTIVSLWMYATPVVYPMSQVTNPTLHRIMELNPITSIIETFKYGLMGAGSFSWGGLGYSVMVAAVLLGVGIPLFNHKQKSYIDTV